VLLNRNGGLVQSERANLSLAGAWSLGAQQKLCITEDKMVTGAYMTYSGSVGFN
jgi:hypothetical protein